jgi:UDP-N-acetylglucosamine diphosphorylase/glucosamine-1-phosphate N-acetyltransferase
MPALSLVLFDDAAALDWEPFTLTRPAGELLFGTLTLRARQEEALGARCEAYLTADHLQGFTEEGAAPVATFGEAPSRGDRVFLSSRAVPEWTAGSAWRERPPREGPITCEGEVVGWFAPEGSPAPPPEFFRDPSSAASGEGTALEGHLLGRVWELVRDNADRITADIGARFPSPPQPRLPDGAFHWGDHPLVLHESARVEPGCNFDTSEGPIWLDRGVVVRAFTRLCGPAYIGPDSHVLGGHVDCVSVGPVCKVRGELTSSIVAGYSNKQHDGHMGHAYLGRWVNLGAGTTNSDLKNNYSAISIWTPQGETDTGEIKLGCLIGDHVKTGIGLLINTGTVIGAGSNLWGAVLPPKFVPPFSWGSGTELTEYRVDKFLQVAERAMGRREVPLAPSSREQLERAFRRGRDQAEPGGAGRG